MTTDLLDRAGSRVADLPDPQFRPSPAAPGRLARLGALLDRLIVRLSGGRPTSTRRSFLGRATVVGTAFALNPWGYLVRPAAAYDAVCGSEAACADGFSVFCCTINNGRNECPPNSFVAGWWKADNSSFCGGAARYYIDCNAFRDGAWQCRCAEGTCDQRRVACNQFRYGQCHLEIPYSQTGPVVCRMVSCTPPWEQHAGVCTTTSATDNRTATHSAPCLSGKPPVGRLDAATVSGLTVKLSGWAYDPDSPAAAVQIAVQVDGKEVARFPTAAVRNDVNTAYKITGTHGYERSIQVSAGRRTIAVHAVGIGGGGNTLLATRAVTATAPPAGRQPIGHLDNLRTAPGSRIRVQGWAFDPDSPDTSVNVAVYRDGVGIGWFMADRPRRDINTVFGIGGNHGFDLTIPSGPGNRTVTVHAINIGGGSGNPLIGKGQVKVGMPTGRLERVAAVAGGVRLTGWAFDPDIPEQEINVAVYRNGVGIAWFPTGKPRGDVNSAYAITGNHGFDLTIPTAAGRHEFAVYAINVGPQAPNVLIGTRTVTR